MESTDRVELRAEGRNLVGTVIRWADQARRTGYTEQVSRDALRWGRVVLNVRHNPQDVVAILPGSLELRSDDEHLGMLARLGSGDLQTRTLEEVRNGTLRGLSVEMIVDAQKWQGGDRTVTQAQLVGVGIVEHPSYKASGVEVRHVRRGRLWPYL